MGLKHRKYIYVKRNDGWFVKVRVLNIRFGKKIEQGDVADPTRYIVTGFRTKTPPHTAVIINEEALPDDARRSLYTV